MTYVLLEIERHGGTDWRVDRVGHNSTDGDYFVINYRNGNRPGRWEMVFGFDGSLWMD
jgi:hypothetical protein